MGSRSIRSVYIIEKAKGKQQNSKGRISHLVLLSCRTIMDGETSHRSDHITYSFSSQAHALCVRILVHLDPLGAEEAEVLQIAINCIKYNRVCLGMGEDHICVCLCVCVVPYRVPSHTHISFAPSL